MVEKLENTAKEGSLQGIGDKYGEGFNPEYKVESEEKAYSGPLCTRPHPPCTPSYCSGPK